MNTQGQAENPPPVLTDHPIGISELLDSPVGICLAFLDVDPDDAEPLRLLHCPVCQESAAHGDDTAQRLEQCKARSCGLRDADLLRHHQEWCGDLLLRLAFADQVTPDDLVRFNAALARWGGLTPALGLRDSGHYRLVLNTRTLRGAVYEAMLELLLLNDGTLLVNVADTNTAALYEELTARRLRWLKTRRRLQHRVAPQLRAQGLSDNAIAKRLGVSPKAIRDWLGPRTSWERGQEGGS